MSVINMSAIKAFIMATGTAVFLNGCDSVSSKDYATSDIYAHIVVIPDHENDPFYEDPPRLDINVTLKSSSDMLGKHIKLENSDYISASLNGEDLILGWRQGYVTGSGYYSGHINHYPGELIIEFQRDKHRSAIWSTAIKPIVNLSSTNLSVSGASPEIDFEYSGETQNTPGRSTLKCWDYDSGYLEGFGYDYVEYDNTPINIEPSNIISLENHLTEFNFNPTMTLENAYSDCISLTIVVDQSSEIPLDTVKTGSKFEYVNADYLEFLFLP